MTSPDQDNKEPPSEMTSRPEDQSGGTKAQRQGSSTSAERTRAYRERLKQQGLERAVQPPCPGCGRPINLALIAADSPRGRSSTGATLCAPCWRKSPEGREAERERDRQRDRSNRKVSGGVKASSGLPKEGPAGP